jgi:hypothetical protein
LGEAVDGGVGAGWRERRQLANRIIAIEMKVSVRIVSGYQT